MGLGDVFVKSVVREIGRNYGKSISNSLLGDSHSTPVRVVGDYLGAGSSTRGYKHKLDKLCKTWQVKGATATFNVAQNMYNAFFELVEEAQADGNVDASEILQLMTAFVDMHKQIIKICKALEDLNKKDFAEKADQLDNQIFDFFVEINNEFVLPPRPKGWFSSKAKKRWDLGKSVKENLERWVSGYQNLES